MDASKGGTAMRGSIWPGTRIMTVITEAIFDLKTAPPTCCSISAQAASLGPPRMRISAT
jgi:hypothetical protein